jgi:hypothetical protein
MLTLEARMVAGVQEVELLDSPYLAALLRELAEEQVRAFADVAIVPDGPESRKEGDRRAAVYEERLAADASNAANAAAKLGYLFNDAPQIQNTKASLQRALFESRTLSSEKISSLLDEWRASVEARRPLVETINSTTFQEFDHKELARLARELHDRVLEKTPGYGEAVADLMSLVDRLPPNTAASIYLGLLASMYLVRTTNSSRLPPSSPIAQLLFERQGADYALHGVAAVAKRLLDNETAPLYVPSVDRPAVLVELDTEPDTPALDQLRSFKVGDVELLTDAQADPALRLSALFDAAEPVDGNAIVHKACELFAMPISQIKRTEIFGKIYALTATIGFKRPVDISIPKERPLGE